MDSDMSPMTGHRVSRGHRGGRHREGTHGGPSRSLSGSPLCSLLALCLIAAAGLGTDSLSAAPPASIADAAMQGDRASVLTLIKQGADVNAPQGDGVTALHWAARRADADLVAALFAAGADPRAATRFGAYTPLHLAAERGSAAITKTLLAAGAPGD